MSSTKRPTDTTAVTGTADNTIDPSTATATVEETSLTLLEKVKHLQSLRQLSHPDPRSIYKGAKIGIGPNGSRRSMGKR